MLVSIACATRAPGSSMKHGLSNPKATMILTRCWAAQPLRTWIVWVTFPRESRLAVTHGGGAAEASANALSAMVAVRSTDAPGESVYVPGSVGSASAAATLEPKGTRRSSALVTAAAHRNRACNVVRSPHAVRMCTQVRAAQIHPSSPGSPPVVRTWAYRPSISIRAVCVLSNLTDAPPRWNGCPFRWR